MSDCSHTALVRCEGCKKLLPLAHPSEPPKPATMTVEEILNTEAFGDPYSVAWFVSVQDIDYGGTGGVEVDVLDIWDIESRLQNGRVQKDEIFVRVK